MTPLGMKFRDQGFVHLKSVLSSDKVKELRTRILDAHGSFSRGWHGMDFFLDHECLYEVQFVRPVLDALADIYGNDFVYVNDCHVQIAFIDEDRDASKWHTDCGSEQAAGFTYMFEPNYAFCKVGIYLQPNSVDFGGGIDVEVGGHKSFKKRIHPNLTRWLYALDRRLLSRTRERRRIETSAGDCLIFDSRLPHAGSPASQKPDSPDDVKITIYWDVAGNLTEAKRFLIHSCHRARDDGEPDFFRTYLSLNYPRDYPKQYVDLVESNEIMIAPRP